MSKQDKKARKVLREKIKVEATDLAESLQGLILKFSFIKRAAIAWRILRGKPFLASAGYLKK